MLMNIKGNVKNIKINQLSFFFHILFHPPFTFSFPLPLKKKKVFSYSSIFSFLVDSFIPDSSQPVSSPSLK